MSENRSTPIPRNDTKAADPITGKAANTLHGNYHDEKEVVPGQEPEVVPGDGLEAVHPTALSRSWTVTRRQKIIAAIALGILAAIGLIIGSVVGTQSASHSTHGSLEPAATTSTPSPVPTPGIPSRAIASVKWSDDQSLNKIRLYYLASSGEIVEVSNRTDGGWDHKGLGFIAKANSSLAAAVSQPNYPLGFEKFSYHIQSLPPTHPLVCVLSHSRSPKINLSTSDLSL